MIDQETQRLLDDGKARAEMVAEGFPIAQIAALYPLAKRAQEYLRDSCQLEPWVDVLPTVDPEFWKMVNVCDEACHYPVHAFGHPERLRHLVEVPPF